MTARWFYAADGAECGPVTVDELNALLVRRVIDRKTFVWRQGMEEWLELDAVTELEELCAHLPPPLPPQATGEIPRVDEPVVPPPPPPAPPAATNAHQQAERRAGPTATAPQPASTEAAEGPDRIGKVVEGASAGAASVLLQRLLARRERKRRERERRRELEAGKKGAVATGFGKLFGGIFEGIGNSLGQGLVKLVQGILAQPAVAAGVALVTVAGTVAVVDKVFLDRPEPAPIEAAAGVDGSGTLQIDANPWGEVVRLRDTDGRRVELPAERITPLALALPAGEYVAELRYPPGSASESCRVTVSADETARCFVELAPVSAESYFERIGW